MRVVIVLVALIGGAAAGLFVGGTTYDALNPAPGVDLPDGSTSDAEALSRSNRQVGAAFDRMEGRKPWLIGGAVAGAVIGVGLVALLGRGRGSTAEGEDSVGQS